MRSTFLVLLLSSAAALGTPEPAERLRVIGDYFCRQSIAGSVAALKDSREVPDVVRVGPTLPDVLAQMRPALQSGYTVEVQRGDAFGEGDGVTHSIIVRTAQDDICLRMRYDSNLDRFHIVGYCGAPLRKTK